MVVLFVALSASRDSNVQVTVCANREWMVQEKLGTRHLALSLPFFLERGGKKEKRAAGLLERFNV